jgi:Tol biopolymer transport system component
MTTNRWVPDAPRAAAKIGAVGAAALGALLATVSPTVAQFAGRPSLANVSGEGIQGNADSWSVAVSADGASVAFASDADNLVPLDTNGDTDVFVHDARSRITRRVSVNWQGKEAQGDNDCPALSADGRYVAFSSRAWNMPQNGENVGTPMWEVYLHDRQGPQTIRVSAPLHGRLGTNHSGCPVIAADGGSVAFASAASDLVPDDTNGASDVFVYEIASGSLTRASLTDDGAQADGPSDAPAISADGNEVAFSSHATNLTPEYPSSTPPFLRGQVYVRDLSAETTELVSNAFAGPLQIPDAESCCPRISADGRAILFHSSASDLIPDTFGPRPVRLFLRDRSTGVTEAVEPLSLGPAGPCWSSSPPFFCDASDTKGAALSADGRFVAFLSGSFHLLPENPPFHQDQIYLQDRHTRRLRRLTVDPTGYPINAYPCGGSSSTLALSADGSVLAFVGGDAEGLGLPDSNGVVKRDVVRLESTCGAEGHCREISLCPGTPATTCEPAQRSRLWIRRNPPLGERRDRFSWRWVGAPAGEGQAFVDPTEGDYHLCVYTGETMNAQVDAAIPPGAPWQAIEKGWQRRDQGGALELVKLRGGSVRSMVTVASSSAALDLPYLPLEAPHGVTVQLHEATTNRCWEAAFPAAALSKNTRGAVTPGGSTPGVVHARFLLSSVPASSDVVSPPAGDR